MKVTLRSARKLEAKIAARIGEGIQYNITFSAYDKVNVTEKFNNAVSNVVSDVNDSINLTAVRYSIRRQIQQLNEESGINQLISDRKRLIETLSIWKGVSEFALYSNSPVSVEITEGKLDAIRNSTSGVSAYGGTTDIVSVHVVTEEFVETANASIRKLERQIEEIDDTILTTNMGTKVTVSDEDVSFLRDQSLI